MNSVRYYKTTSTVTHHRLTLSRLSFSWCISGVLCFLIRWTQLWPSPCLPLANWMAWRPWYTLLHSVWGPFWEPALSIWPCRTKNTLKRLWTRSAHRQSVRRLQYLWNVLSPRNHFHPLDLLAQVPTELNAGQALGIEVLCTFQMVFTVFAVCDQKRRDCIEPGNLAIGFAHSSGSLLGVRMAFSPRLFPRKIALHLCFAMTASAGWKTVDTLVRWTGLHSTSGGDKLRKTYFLSRLKNRWRHNWK